MPGNPAQRPYVGASLAVVAFALALAGPLRPDPRSETATQSGGSAWLVQVDNVSPEGHAWGFDAFYPSRLQAHAGDTITFRVAENINAFHNVSLLPVRQIPVQGYSGFMLPDPLVPGGLQTTFFAGHPNFAQDPRPECGRAGTPPCVWDGERPMNSGVLVIPPAPDAGQGNRTFALQLGPSMAPGTYFFLCLVHGPGMNGSVDLLPAGTPAQSAAALEADAARAYAADLADLTRLSRDMQVPGLETNPDGTRTWTLAAGGGGPDARLSVDEFGVRALVIRTGDTVLWTMQGPAGVVHTVSGFSADEAEPPRLPVFEAACEAPTDGAAMAARPEPGSMAGTGRGQMGARGPTGVPGERGRSEAGVFPLDIWNGCPGR